MRDPTPLPLSSMPSPGHRGSQTPFPRSITEATEREPLARPRATARHPHAACATAPRRLARPCTTAPAALAAPATPVILPSTAAHHRRYNPSYPWIFELSTAAVVHSSDLPCSGMCVCASCAAQVSALSNAYASTSGAGHLFKWVAHTLAHLCASSPRSRSRRSPRLRLRRPKWRARSSEGGGRVPKRGDARGPRRRRGGLS
jgi:hypothetical protein